MAAFSAFSISLLALLAANAVASSTALPKPPAGTPINFAAPLARNLTLDVPYTEGAGMPTEMVSGTAAVAGAWPFRWVVDPVYGPSIDYTNSSGAGVAVANITGFQTRPSRIGFSWAALFRMASRDTVGVTRIGDTNTIAGFVVYPTVPHNGTCTVAPREANSTVRLIEWDFAGTPWIAVATVYAMGSDGGGDTVQVWTNLDAAGAPLAAMRMVSELPCSVAESWGVGTPPATYFLAGTEWACCTPAAVLTKQSIWWERVLDEASIQAWYQDPWAMYRA